MIRFDTMKNTDVQIRGCRLYFLPIRTRIPLKFGAETLTEVTCARVRLAVATRDGRMVHGWGETPLSVQWVWPSSLSYSYREKTLIEFTRILCAEWAAFDEWGHPMEIGYDFQLERLPEVLARFNAGEETAGTQARRDERESPAEPIPYLAALVCCSLYDIALHDAFGVAHRLPTYSTYTSEFMSRDLSQFYAAAMSPDASPTSAATPSVASPASLSVSAARPVPPPATPSAGEVLRGLRGRLPADFLSPPTGTRIPAWHLVGGKDLIRNEDLTGDEPDDGYPVVLDAWIRRDGLSCLKVKLTGTDSLWDYERLSVVGSIARRWGVRWLTADFNCRVHDPEYVNRILDSLRDREPQTYGMILYVEQPFPYDLEAHPIDVHSVSARKPLFMDESAHDWQLVERGFHLGWSGVALKTCKTQTGALLALCWAKARGMTLMVQDLTNPMLAQIPHLQLGYYAGTIMGVETNAMQFYPEVSRPERDVHPGMFERREGMVDLATSLPYPGFGYRIDEVDRPLGDPDSSHGE